MLLFTCAVLFRSNFSYLKYCIGYHDATALWYVPLRLKLLKVKNNKNPLNFYYNFSDFRPIKIESAFMSQS